ncbi:MAG: SAM-dependent methyltransferase [Chitinophagales bacterium]|nr:MAG: SAM-dependent methyltransferase [Chitinophagales bacterium]
MRFFLETLLHVGKLQGKTPRLLFRALHAQRKLIGKVYDPIVELSSKYITGTTSPELPDSISIPFSHELPFYILKYPGYSSNVGRIAAAVHQKYPAFTFIDTGANIGDTIYMLRKYASFPVLCIEGDDYYYHILKRNASRFGQVKTVKSFVGAENTILEASSSRQGGTAHLQVTGKDHIHLKTIPAILQEHPEFTNSKMIKIDTDGHDGKIIRGAASYLTKVKPIIFFEYDPYFLSLCNDNGLSILHFLLRHGYQSALIYDNFGFLQDAVDLHDFKKLEYLDSKVQYKMGCFYYDICAFPAEEHDLYTTIWKTEAFYSRNGLS